MITGPRNAPIVLPVYHQGMHNILARGQSLVSLGHHVQMQVGEPIQFDDILVQFRAGTLSEAAAHGAAPSNAVPSRA